MILAARPRLTSLQFARQLSNEKGKLSTFIPTYSKTTRSLHPVMLRQVVLPLARRSVFSRQAGNASATATAILVKRTTAAFNNAAGFHTTSRACDEEDAAPVKAPRKKKTASEGTTKKKAAPKKAKKPKAKAPAKPSALFYSTI